MISLRTKHFKMPNGCVYIGDTQDGNSHGWGQYRDHDGFLIYLGQYANGKRNGKGVNYFSDGSRYEGEWENDAMDGFGQMSYPDGSRYSGGWKEGKRAGIGKMTYPDGTVQKGEWMNDSRVA